MTLAEFEKWFEEKYRVLLATAGRRVGYHMAEEAVAGAVLRILSTRSYERCETKPLSWLMQAVKSVAANMRRSDQRILRASVEMQKVTNPSKGKRTKPKYPNYSDDWEDDRESVSPPTSARRVATGSRDWA